jgi:integrase
VANPVSDIALPSPALPRTRRITRREEKLLCRAFRDYANPQLGLIFRIAIETGMRASEIRGLKVCDVDLRRRTALISTTKNGTTRLIPLTITAAKALKDTITRRGRPAGCPWVFWGAVDRHGQCKPYCFQHAWWRTLVRLNLIGLRFHDLRHEAISRFVEMGMSDVEVAAISGHKTMQMLKRYVHLRTEHLLWRLDHPVRRK